MLCVGSKTESDQHFGAPLPLDHVITVSRPTMSVPLTDLLPAKREEVFPEDEELCLATLEDRETVLDIDRTIYRGQDYLPTLYASHVTGPGTTGYLYKKQGKVVGFLSVQIIDDGQTLLTSAGRIAAEFRGGGMYGRFTRRVFQEHRRLPNICNVVMTINTTNMAAIGDRLLKTYRMVSERVMTNINFNVPKMKSKLMKQPEDISSVRKMPRDEVQAMITRDPDQLTHIFPDGRIILCWKPYRVVAANADIILPAKTSRVFLIRAEDSPQNGTMASCEDTLVSCGSYYRCAMGVRCAIDIYGNGSDEQVQAHVEWHLLRFASAVDAQEVLVHVYFSRTVDNIVENLREIYPVALSDWPCKKVTLIEADFRKLL